MQVRLPNARTTDVLADVLSKPVTPHNTGSGNASGTTVLIFAIVVVVIAVIVGVLYWRKRRS